ncbi:MAG: peptidoglycan-associated lipoprotein [Legionellales bacterium RIFCSPHIGHO2_12_FULL_37_14]|nr:MAG: peptidoglycan-associated lipoprotein [Legionellales bacterium RIFCSPHIGHO2_12_FULL_37_14]
MKITKTLKYGLLIGAISALAACSKNTGQLDGGFGDASVLTSGLGKFTHFMGQRAGESYTTKAPYNQLYLFDYDSSKVNPIYIPSLEAQAAYLHQNPGARVMIAGHTDERGSREYNVALGERRALSVAHVLKESGVSSKQMRIVSYGKERPINLGHSQEAHAQNRRVEFIYEATR